MEHTLPKMNSTYKPMPLIIDPFILHFFQSTIEPPPPLPSSIFFYDPFLIIPPPPSINVSQVRLTYANHSEKQTLLFHLRIHHHHRHPNQIFPHVVVIHLYNH